MISQKETKNTATSLITPRMSFVIMPGGDIGAISYGDHLIGTERPETEGGLATLFLRLEDDQGAKYASLIGQNASGAWQIKDRILFYQGTIQGVEYRIRMMPGNGIWFYDVHLRETGHKKRKCQLFFGPKINIDAANVSYPHLDNALFTPPHGHTLISGPLPGTNIYLQSGSLMDNADYAAGQETLFMQDLISGGTGKKNPSKVSDLLAAGERYHLLESKAFSSGDDVKAVFFEKLVFDIGTFFSQPIDFAMIEEEYRVLCQDCYQGDPDVRKNHEKASPLRVLQSANLTGLELDTLYPLKHRQTYKENILQSFYLEDHHLVMIPSLMDQDIPAHVLSSGCDLIYDPMILTCSLDGNFITGLKTGFDFRPEMTSSERIMVKEDGDYRFLGRPSVFEIGANSAKWLYKLKDDVIMVELAVDYTLPLAIMKVRSMLRKPHDYSGIENLFIGKKTPVTVSVKNHVISYQPESDDAWYEVVYSADNITFPEDRHSGKDNTAITYEIKNAREFSKIIKLRKSDIPLPAIGDLNISRLKAIYDEKLEKVIGHFHVRTQDKTVMAFNDIVWWNAHYALIDYLYLSRSKLNTGHMEKWYSTAEFLRTFGHYQLLKELLTRLFTSLANNQEKEVENIIWPMKALSVYLEDTGDFSFLNCEVPIVNEGHTIRISVRQIINRQIKDLNAFYQRYATLLESRDWEIYQGYLANELTSEALLGQLVETLGSFGTLLEHEDSLEKNELCMLISAMKKTYYEHFIQKKEPKASFTSFDRNRYLWQCHQALIYDLLESSRQMLMPTGQFLNRISGIGWTLEKKSTLLQKRSGLKLMLLSDLKDGLKVLHGLLEAGETMPADGLPGIYLSVLIRHLLGFISSGRRLVLRPIMPKSLDGLKLRLSVNEKAYEMTYVIKGNHERVTKMIINNHPLDPAQLFRLKDDAIIIPPKELGGNNTIYLET
jgi:hypothetical protein